LETIKTNIDGATSVLQYAQRLTWNLQGSPAKYKKKKITNLKYQEQPTIWGGRELRKTNNIEKKNHREGGDPESKKLPSKARHGEGRCSRWKEKTEATACRGTSPP